MDSSANRAFAIPKLLEQILLYVDGDHTPLIEWYMNDLFALQRVNRTFRATVRSSTRLRRGMGMIDDLRKDWSYANYEPIHTDTETQKDLKFYGLPDTVLVSDSLTVMSNVMIPGDRVADEKDAVDTAVVGQTMCLYNNKHEAWRGMSISAAMVRTNVLVRVRVERRTLSRLQKAWVRFLEQSLLSRTLPDEFEYIERFCLTNGKETVEENDLIWGQEVVDDLATKMKEIARTNEWWHIMRAAFHTAGISRALIILYLFDIEFVRWMCFGASLPGLFFEALRLSMYLICAVLCGIGITAAIWLRRHL